MSGLRLPFSAAAGNIEVHDVTHATIFGFEVWLLPEGKASVIDPPHPDDPTANRSQYPLLDTYTGLVNFAKIDNSVTLAVSVGPRHLAQVVAGRHIPFERLADEYIRYSPGTGTWEFVVPATADQPELIIIVHPGLTDTVSGREV